MSEPSPPPSGAPSAGEQLVTPSVPNTTPDRVAPMSAHDFTLLPMVMDLQRAVGSLEAKVNALNSDLSRESATFSARLNEVDSKVESLSAIKQWVFGGAAVLITVSGAAWAVFTFFGKPPDSTTTQSAKPETTIVTPPRQPPAASR